MLKKIESGRHDIDLFMYTKSSDVFRVSIEHLMFGKVMAEDQFVEPIVYKSQIGSVMYASRIRLANQPGKDSKKKYSLKSVAKVLGISSMELKRIEALSRSKYLFDSQFLHKVESLFGIPFAYAKDLRDTSFPRGEKRKDQTVMGDSQIRDIKDGQGVRGLVVRRGDLSSNDLKALKGRIELEISFLRSKSNPK